MECTCFSLIIRDRICQSGVPVTSEQVYSTIPSDTVILQNGYTLIISNGSSDNILLNFINISLDIDVTFSIQSGTSQVYDLPIDSGTYRVGVFMQKSTCNQTACCPH